jgi:hypothetical protein
MGKWVYSSSFLRVNGQLQAPAALPLGKQPRYPYLGGWVGPRAGLDVWRKEKTYARTGNRTTTPWSSNPDPSRYTK